MHDPDDIIQQLFGLTREKFVADYLGKQSDAYFDARELADSSVIVTNGVKATQFSSDEVTIFRRIHNARPSATVNLQEISESGYLQVVNRLSALSLVEPADA